MHSNNPQSNDPTPEDLASQAHAHALEASLQTMEEFLDQAKRTFITTYEPAYRATSDPTTSFKEKIAVVQSLIESGELNDAQKAEYGYELTRFIPLVHPNRSDSTSMVVFYEGRLSGVRGYGIVKIEKTPSKTPVVEIEVFTSPQHLLEVYGDEVVLTAARAINNRNDELRMFDAFGGPL